MDNLDDNLIDIYTKFKHILSGCRTIYDSLYFAQDIIQKNPQYKTFINNMIHGKTYEKILDFRKVAQTLNILNEFKLQNEVNEYINNNIKENYDVIQVGTFMRIGKNKNLIRNDDDKKIYKLIDIKSTTVEIKTKDIVDDNIIDIDNIIDK
jgi:hypothetical protein